MRRGYLAAAFAAVLGAVPALAQYDLPLSRPAARDLDDPKPVYKYELKPEHGQFMVCVKTFRGASAGDARVKELAEGLAEYIRSECRLYAFVYERGWALRQDRAKEKAAVIAAKKKYLLEQGISEDQITDRMLQVKMARIPDEYAVLVAPGKGTLKSQDEALEFAKYVRKLAAPPREFCDAVLVGTEKDLARKQGEPVNPFLTAFAGPNPTIPKGPTGSAGPARADEFLKAINAGQPYSLIEQTKKPVTLVVKIYGAQAGHWAKAGEVAQASGRSDGAMLERIAQQAHALAKTLRAMRYDAYVLHTRYESFVCVGEYDSKDDAELKANMKALAGLPLKKEKTGELIETLMEKPLPAAIPR